MVKWVNDHTLQQLAQVLEERKDGNTDRSYVAKLYAEGDDAILQKIGEEAIETLLAAKSNNSTDLVHEIADLWFHTLVLLAHKGLGPQDILIELSRRFGLSGLEEKASRTKSK